MIVQPSSLDPADTSPLSPSPAVLGYCRPVLAHRVPWRGIDLRHGCRVGHRQHAAVPARHRAGPALPRHRADVDPHRSALAAPPARRTGQHQRGPPGGSAQRGSRRGRGDSGRAGPDQRSVAGRRAAVRLPRPPPRQGPGALPAEPRPCLRLLQAVAGHRRLDAVVDHRPARHAGPRRADQVGFPRPGDLRPTAGDPRRPRVHVLQVPHHVGRRERTVPGALRLPVDAPAGRGLLQADRRPAQHQGRSLAAQEHPRRAAQPAQRAARRHVPGRSSPRAARPGAALPAGGPGPVLHQGGPDRPGPDRGSQPADHAASGSRSTCVTSPTRPCCWTSGSCWPRCWP